MLLKSYVQELCPLTTDSLKLPEAFGLTYKETMTAIIFPQAFQNILPALANEAIVLLKETSISGYIGS